MIKQYSILALLCAALLAGAPARELLILDAGHGGADGGAVSLSGAKESEINLSITLRAEQIAAFCGVKTKLTRSDEKINYSKNASTLRKMKIEDQQNRLKLIKGASNAVMISVHQNSYPASGPHGPQVLYAPTDGSAEWGSAAQKLLNDKLCPASGRAAAVIPENIFLMNHISCPALLIECGFLTNPAEEALLLTETYQTKLAAAIISIYLQKGGVG